MGRTVRLLAAAAMVAGLAAAPAGSASQCRLCGDPKTRLVEEGPSTPITLEIEATLDFDRLVLLDTGEGSATLGADGSRMVTGAIASLGGRAMVGTALIRGEPGRPVRVAFPKRIEMYSLSGGRIVLDEIVSDLPGMPKLDRSGSLAFRFGGRLRVSGAAEGEYRGDVPITVEYH